MENLNRQTANIPPAFPEKVLQFGGGNFLRSFVGWILDVYNEKTNSGLGILVVKPTERGDYQSWREQEGLFHVLTKGVKKGEVVDEKYLVKSISRIIHPYREWDTFLESAENPDLRIIISNTTESGIRFSKADKLVDQPPKEFPAKLTLWLYYRYQHFKASKDAACIFIPTELLEENGQKLLDTLLLYAAHWNLPADFSRWLQEDQHFCNTLVDRIVPGVSKEALKEVQNQLGFQDAMVSQGEPYHLWAIEAPEAVRGKLPLDKIGLNVIYTDDLTPFRKSKVRILNGAHTAMVPVGYLYGLETVGESVNHELMGAFMNQVIFEEILPSLDLPEVDLTQFAHDVLDRFRNPFIKHKLISIALNSISKLRVRVLPSILNYVEKKGELPQALVFAFASTIRFYKGSWQGEAIPLNDDAETIAFFDTCWKSCDDSSEGLKELVQKVLSEIKFWEQDLNNISGLSEMIGNQLIKLKREGVENVLKAILS